MQFCTSPSSQPCLIHAVILSSETEPWNKWNKLVQPETSKVLLQWIVGYLYLCSQTCSALIKCENVSRCVVFWKLLTGTVPSVLKPEHYSHWNELRRGFPPPYTRLEETTEWCWDASLTKVALSQVCEEMLQILQRNLFLSLPIYLHKNIK